MSRNFIHVSLLPSRTALSVFPRLLLESLTQTARGQEEEKSRRSDLSRVIEAQQRSEGTSISILSVDTLLNDLANKSIDLSAMNTFLSLLFPIITFRPSFRWGISNVPRTRLSTLVDARNPIEYFNRDNAAVTRWFAQQRASSV